MPDTLESDYGHVILDLIDFTEYVHGFQPWDDYGTNDDTDPKITELGYMDLVETVRRFATALCETADVQSAALILQNNQGEMK